MNSIHKGDQYIHLKIVIPKNLTPKQKELLLEFEKEGNPDNSTNSSSSDGNNSTRSEKKSNVSSTIESAWNRLKEFMNSKEEDNKKK